MRSMVEGAGHEAQRQWRTPSTTTLRVAVPLPVNGEDLVAPIPRHAHPHRNGRSRRGFGAQDTRP